MFVDFRLVGQTALLMHADDIDASELVKAWQKDPANKKLSVAGDDRSPPWTWQGYLYRDKNHIAMPSENVMVCLRQAGARMILKGNKTYKEDSQSGAMIVDEFCDFLVAGKKVPFASIHKVREKSFSDQSDAARKLGFRIWCKRARVGQAKHVRARPRFDDWEVRGRMQVFAEDILTPEIIKQLFEIAGRIGLCDWRPGCKTPGSFGMFTSELKFS